MSVQELAGRLTITVPEAGGLLGLGRGAAYAAANRGEIPTLRMGGRLLVPVPRLLRLLGYGELTGSDQEDCTPGASSSVDSRSGESAVIQRDLGAQLESVLIGSSRA